MGSCRALVAALMLASLSGCSGETRSASLLQRFRPFQAPAGPEVVKLDVAVAQIPLGDTARYRDLWTFLDEQAVSLDRKSLLEDNGFRVGKVGASPPEELLELTSARYCADPRRIHMQGGGKDERSLDIGEPIHKGSIQVVRGDQSNKIELDEGQLCLSVTPTLTDDGRTRLQIVPRLKQLSRPKMAWLPRPDRAGWTRQTETPSETFPDLSWDVTLSPGEYLVIGPREDRPGTVGHQSFLRTDEKAPVQRLLILRTWREGGSPRLADRGNETNRVQPLAVQAAYSARGTCP